MSDFSSGEWHFKGCSVHAATSACDLLAAGVADRIILESAECLVCIALAGAGAVIFDRSFELRIEQGQPILVTADQCIANDPLPYGSRVCEMRISQPVKTTTIYRPHEIDTTVMQRMTDMAERFLVGSTDRSRIFGAGAPIDDNE